MTRIIILIGSILFFSCTTSTKQEDEKVESTLASVPKLNQDSAYYFVEKQVSFGPRIPNTSSHKKTGDYLSSALRKFGAKVIEQNFESMSYDGKKLFLRNIIATYFPDKQKRILLAAHWDTRPFADKDKVDPTATYDGANDGASGVGVLLEIARLLKTSTPPNVGIDIIFFDGEDYGTKPGESGPTLTGGQKSWWVLGSQYWVAHKHQPNYTAYYGILLDMVGAKGSKFFREGISMEYAPSIVTKVWSTASQMGLSSIFVNRDADKITDDNWIVSEVAKIPMIDIVHYDPVVGYFGEYHHTTKDNLEIIDKEMLGLVGQVVVQVIYNEP